MTLAQVDQEEAVSAEQPGPAVNRPSRRRKWLIRAVTYPILAYGMWCTGLYFAQDQLVFPRHFAPEPLARVPGYVQEMTIKTEEGRDVPGWFIAASGVSAENPGPAVLYFHGNAEIIDYELRIEGLWHDMQMSILFVEYRGYGRARDAGDPSEEALVVDGVKFYDELIKRPDVDPARIVIHGYSIGGGVAAQVAAQRKPAALVLESTFTSIASFAWGYGVPSFLTTNPFHTDEVLPKLGVPIFIAHGRRDNIVPVEHGRRLQAIVPDATYVELDCGHLDLSAGGPNSEYAEQIRSFLVRSSVLEADPAAPAE